MNNRLIIVLLILTGLNTAFLSYTFLTNKGSTKIAVVQMDRLVYEYKGMIDATKNYTVLFEKWNKQVDSIENRMQVLWNGMRQDSINGASNDLILKQQQFYQSQSSYLSLKNKIKERGVKDDQDMTLGILNQIREHIKNYAMEKNYDLILANTQLENIAFASSMIDVTEPLLDYANNEYEYGQ